MALTVKRPSQPNSGIEAFFNGTRLIGDDFDAEAIRQWFEVEQSAYVGLVSDRVTRYAYEYHALNWLHGFSHLGDRVFERVLGFGSFRGDELEPLLDRVKDITVVDPSVEAEAMMLGDKPVRAVRPAPSGKLVFANGEFDLITCFGALHHIPNVSTVVGELLRVLRPGGALLIREPIVSMGDWRQPRPGLTANERGIPLPLLRRMLQEHGGKIERLRLCSFAPLERLFKLARSDIYNSRVLALIDAAVCNSLAWRVVYHPRHAVQKLQPSSVFLCVTTDR
jgi:SAM-dependent methyltransferase